MRAAPGRHRSIGNPAAKRRLKCTNNRSAGRPNNWRVKIQLHFMAARQNKRACNRIRNVIMRTWPVINRIPAAARRLALKTVQLRYQPAIVEKVNLAAIQ